MGVKAVGRSRRLSTNYRNTKEILTFAWGVTQATQPEDTEPEIHVHVRVQPDQILRSGPPPACKGCANPLGECEVVVGLVRRLLSQGLRPESVCVLYPRNVGGRVGRLVEGLTGLGDVCQLTSRDVTDTHDGFVKRPGVRLSTIHSAKGLEFPAVILCGLDLLPRSASDVAADVNLLYVGLTRATDQLFMTWTGQSEFTQRVEQSPAVCRL